MATPSKKSSRSRPSLESHDVKKLEGLIGEASAMLAKLKAAKQMLEAHGPNAYVRINYAIAVQDGIAAIGWMADDIKKKIDQRKVWSHDGRLPSNEEKLPEKPSKNAPKRKSSKERNSSAE